MARTLVDMISATEMVFSWDDCWTAVIIWEEGGWVKNEVSRGGLITKTAITQPCTPHTNSCHYPSTPHTWWAELKHSRKLSDGAQLHEPVASHRLAEIHIMQQVMWTEVVFTVCARWYDVHATGVVSSYICIRTAPINSFSSPHPILLLGQFDFIILIIIIIIIIRTRI